jgi:hypothetical protein
VLQLRRVLSLGCSNRLVQRRDPLPQVIDFLLDPALGVSGVHAEASRGLDLDGLSMRLSSPVSPVHAKLRQGRAEA